MQLNCLKTGHDIGTLMLGHFLGSPCWNKLGAKTKQRQWLFIPPQRWTLTLRELRARKAKRLTHQAPPLFLVVGLELVRGFGKRTAKCPSCVVSGMRARNHRSFDSKTTISPAGAPSGASTMTDGGVTLKASPGHRPFGTFTAMRETGTSEFSKNKVCPASMFGGTVIFMSGCGLRRM